MSEFVIELQGVTKTYGASVVLRDIDLQIRHGEFITLLGPSGCGKTTILRLIAGFEAPTRGRILLDGRDMEGMPPERRQVNTVFQSYALFPHMSVFDNVAFGPRMRKVEEQQAQAQALEALRSVKLEAFADRRPQRLSGGQQQRVALARALVNRPLVLLLDECLSALDFKLRKTMQVELKQLQRRLGVTFVYVTHDQEEALAMSDRVAVMNMGFIEQIGSPREIYETPKNLFVARFVGDINVLPGKVVGADGVRCHIAVQGKIVALKSPRPFAVGDRVNVLLRPEDLRIWREGEGSEQERANLFPAAVEEVTYKGSTVDMLLRLEDGSLLSTTQFFNEDDPACINLDFRRGERVYVDWVHDWETLLPYED